jgi:hypothetical protein
MARVSDQCARAECDEPRTAEGRHQYCSLACWTISHIVHAGPLPPLPEWSWAPQHPHSLRCR